MIENNMHVSQIRDYLKEELVKIDERIKINADTIYKTNGNLSVRVEGLNGKDLVLMLDMYGIYVSTGSACNSLNTSASHVLTAIGLTEIEAKNTIRFSLNHNNTKVEMDYIVTKMREILSKIDI